MRGLIVAMLATVTGPALAAEVPEPPSPRVGRLADYAAWYNEAFGSAAGRQTAAAYTEAVAAYVPDAEVEALLDKRGLSRLTPNEFGVVEAWLTRNEAALTQLARASRAAACFFPVDPNETLSIGLADFDLAPYQWLGRALEIRAQVALQRSDVAACVRDCATLIRVGVHFQQQPRVLLFVQGAGLRATAYEILLALPGQTRWPVDYDEVIAVLRRVDPPSPTLLAALAVQEARLYEALQQAAADLQPGQRLEGPLGPYERHVRKVGGYYRRWQVVVASDQVTGRERAGRLRSALATEGQAAYDAIADYWPTIELGRQAETLRRGLRLALYVRKFEREKGRWPQTLDEALPNGAEGIARDPFANDEDFIYRLRSREPWLYSVGADGMEGRGEPGRAELNEPGRQAGDLVILPRRGGAMTVQPR